MVDPTHDEMLDYLKSEYAMEFAEDTDDSPNALFSAEAAIYWFASDWHSGMGSNLYSACSTSEYHPSVLEYGADDLESLDRMMYDDLERKFAYR